MKAEKRIAPGTILLAAANVIVFFYLTFQGMTEDGAFMLEPVSYTHLDVYKRQV